MGTKRRTVSGGGGGAHGGGEGTAGGNAASPPCHSDPATAGTAAQLARREPPGFVLAFTAGTRRQRGSRTGGHRVCLFGVALLAAAVGFAARVQPRQVNGVLGGSVLLSPALPPNKMVKEIEWSFSAGAGAAIQVAEFGPKGFERPDPKDRFKDRLEMFDETALKIGALERGDSGVYGARIKLQPAEVEDQSFNLSVSEPLPDPRNPELAAFQEPCVVLPRAAVPRTRRDRGHRHLDETQGGNRRGVRIHRPGQRVLERR
ncbi:uncharacterized protein M6G45_016023 [Spheniscus humboldti]